MDFTITVSESHYPTPQTITKDDVWGKESTSMIVSRSPMTCPHFKDMNDRIAKWKSNEGKLNDGESKKSEMYGFDF